MIKDVKKNKIESIVSFLILSDWDPFVYEDFADFINDQLFKMDGDLVDFISENLKKVAEKFNYLPKAYYIFFDMGIFYQNLERYEEAIYYYEISKSYFGETYTLFYNKGLCYYYDDQFELALENFLAAKKIKRRDVDANKWILKVSKKSSEKILMNMKRQACIYYRCLDGIGAACAKIFAEHGAKLLLCARNEKNLLAFQRNLSRRILQAWKYGLRCK